MSAGVPVSNTRHTWSFFVLFLANRHDPRLMRLGPFLVQPGGLLLPSHAFAALCLVSFAGHHLLARLQLDVASFPFVPVVLPLVALEPFLRTLQLTGSAIIGDLHLLSFHAYKR